MRGPPFPREKREWNNKLAPILCEDRESGACKDRSASLIDNVCGTMKIEAVLWVALASSFAWASSPVEEQSPVQVSVSFSLAAPVVTLREPVLVRCRIRNGLSQTVLVDFGDSIESAFSFRIVDPSERSWDISPPLSSGIAPVPRWQLSPGESRSEELLLDKWYRFDQPGSYEIEPAVAVAVSTTSSEVIPRTATLTLNLVVRPRDEEVLRRRCESLVRETMQKDAARVLEAGEILSYVDDPVAVPFLAEVVRKSWGASYLGVEGLARIHSIPAIEAMIDLLKDPQVSQDSHELLAGRLRGIRSRTTDPEIKSLIDQALGD